MAAPLVQNLPPALAAAARQVAQRLASRGFRAWIVGGAVRDLALGRPPKDLDLCSAATPDEVEALFPEAIGVGRAFGTMTLPGFACPLEVTTFRSDGAYADGRRPSRVEFGASLEQDAARRDFTLNALYLDPLTGELADPTGGLADLRAGLLRAVGVPERRFDEDRLRVLRLARFAGRFGFAIDPATRAAAASASADLAALSAERVAGELRGIFGQAGYPRGIQELEALGVRASLLGYSLPAPGVLDRGLERLSALEPQAAAPGLALGLCLWWLPGASLATLDLERAKALAAQAMERLKLARDEARELAELWSGLARVGELEAEPAPRASAIRLLRRVPERAFAQLLRLPDTDLDRSAVKRLELLLAADLRSRPSLLDGEALAALGIARGPGMKAWLTSLETWQLEGRLQDSAQAAAQVRRCLAAGWQTPPLWPLT